MRVDGLKDVIVGDVGRSLWLLFAAVSVLLLIACTNIAALLLARTADRQQEISIRYSLGASRASIIGQLLTESLVLAVVGSLVGLAVAAGALRTFAELGQGLPRVSELAARLDAGGVLAVLRGRRHAAVRPAFPPCARRSGRPATWRRGAALSLRRRTGCSGCSSASRSRWLFRCCSAPGCCSAASTPSDASPPASSRTRVLTFRISGDWGETADMKALRRRMDATLASLRALPGVDAAATTLAAPGVPFEHPTEMRIVEGGATANQRIMASTRVVSEGYFTTMQIPVLAGTACPQESPAPTALVNRRFAALYLAGAAPLGRHVEHVPPIRSSPPPASSASSATPAKRGSTGSRRRSSTGATPLPCPLRSSWFARRTEPMAMAQTIRRKLGELEPRRSVYEMAPLQDRLHETFAENRLRTMLLTFFAVTAMSLAAIGLYGTLSYFVHMRRREIGVRMALGALQREVATSFVRQALRVSLVGCVAGLSLAAVLGRAIAGMLYGVSPLDFVTFSGVLLLVLGAAVLASVWPAVRAARVDPMDVLRIE